MSRSRWAIKALSVVVFSVAFAPLAQAQAMRTWVSGVGDDVNPCSRTAPCKTFAGAISKTAKNGEISVLDPGGFGAVTITKSITIDGSTGAGFGSILASGVPGVIINITDVNDLLKTVTLRNLSINGATTGTSGVRILSATKVSIENCQIFGFGGGVARGIDDNRTANVGARLFVKDSIIRNNGQSGIVILTPGANPVKATIDNVAMFGNGNAGLAVDQAAAVVSRSVASDNNSHGLFVNAGTLFAENNVITRNTNGITVQGVSTVLLSNNVVTANVTAGVSGAAVQSLQNNKIVGNAAGGAADNLPVGSTNVNPK